MQLLPHQVKAVEFGMRHKTHLIADAPGLGKTYEALAISRALGVPPAGVGIIVPRNVRRQWIQASQEMAMPGVNLVTYENAGKEVPRLKACRHLVVDESHYLKNADSQRFRLVAPLCQDPGKAITLLSGTPVLSYPRDLWAQLFCLRLVPWESYQGFLLRYCNPKPMPGRGGLRLDTRGLDNSQELKFAYSPWVLRRTWEDAGVKMPPLTITDVDVDLVDEGWAPGSRFARDFQEYEAAAANFNAWWKQTTGQDPAGAEKFTVLRRLLARAKVGAVLQHLQGELKNKCKILIFTEFRDVAEIVHAGAQQICKDSYLVMGGQTEARRQGIFDLFSLSPAPAVVVATTDSLNVGVNVQAATRVFFVDQGVKPAAFVQAIHRAWRIGQDKPVSVVRFLVQDSMDSWVAENLCRKEDYMAQLGLKGAVSAGIQP